MPATNSTAARIALIHSSIEVIRRGQTPEGAYLASPTFPTYHYSWFRDGAFIAEAMDEWGEWASASAFHDWALRTLDTQAPLMESVSADEAHDPAGLLHTRYRADGSPGTTEWPNFQLDGLGTWLWAFQRHQSRTGTLLNDQDRRIVRLVSNYLVALWPRPNFDCWEEYPDDIHPSTLGAIYAGLQGAARVLGDQSYTGAAEAVRSHLLAHGVRNGHFSKHIGSDEVDANLLWLTHPYGVLPAEHPISRETARKVRAELLDPEGGVHRYSRDSYYGGGSWIILSAALAHDHLAVGDRREAHMLLSWIEAQATPEGHLPEQTSRYMNDPSRLAEWEERWGKSACPLLWSHAAYLSLLKAMEGARAFDSSMPGPKRR